MPFDKIDIGSITREQRKGRRQINPHVARNRGVLFDPEPYPLDDQPHGNNRPRKDKDYDP
jgi:hypothetical protein